MKYNISTIPGYLEEQVKKNEQGVDCCSVRYSYLTAEHSCYEEQMLKRFVLRT